MGKIIDTYFITCNAEQGQEAREASTRTSHSVLHPYCFRTHNGYTQSRLDIYRSCCILYMDNT